MKIVIAGVGETGNYLAQILLREGHDLALIEKSEKAFANAQEHLDAQIVHGNCANALVLEPLIEETTDLFVALTDNDEANILAALIARKFGVKRAIVRVADSSNLIHPLLTEDTEVSTLNAEMAVAKDLIRLIGNPTADEIEFFAAGKAVMVKLHVEENSKLVHKALRDIDVPKSWLFIAFIRGGQFNIVTGDSVLRPEDQVLVVGDPEKYKAIEELLGIRPAEVKRVILIGYNVISSMLAKSLTSKKIDVRLIEEHKAMAEKAAAELDNALVLHGDATTEEILEQAGIDQADVLVALTRDDETNVLISLLGKEKKVGRVIVLAQKPQYKPLIEKIGIDSVINVRSAMVDEVIRLIHHEDLTGINILEGGQGQMLEFVIKDYIRIVGQPLSKVKLPKQTLIGAVVRNEKLVIPRGDDKLAIGDHVVVFAKRSAFSEIKKIFTA